ncbi:Xaa-Pro dipeptidase [Clostridia bacterium]|nr:Xaa-Pro dipeptidase [Clostridia bacterium]
MASERAAHVGYELTIAQNLSEYFPLLRQTVEKAGYGTIGFEAHTTVVSRLDMLRELLPVKLVPSGKLVESLRVHKNAWEAEKIETAQRLSERALKSVLTFIRPGVSEFEIAREIAIALYREGAEELSFPVIALSGPNTSKPLGRPSERVVEPGDFVTLDFGMWKDNYASDMTRTFAVGFATDEMRAVYDVVLNAQLTGIAAAKIGVTGHEADSAARAVIEKAGYGHAFTHLLGHGVGTTVSEAPQLNIGERAPLPEGAVFSIEPGIYLPGQFGVRIEDLVWLSPNGSRNLTHAPKELVIL